MVDLDPTCPLKSWQKQKQKQKKHSSSSDSDHEEEAKAKDEEEEASCSGGGVAQELDEGAPQLCTVNGAGGDGISSSTSLLHSNALNSLFSKGGFESKAQKDTFAWQQQTDMVVTSEETEQPCEEEILPDSFWIDICSNIQNGHGAQVVNLALNPEHNTGYNGTHIWKAIYEENCIFASSATAASSDGPGTSSSSSLFSDQHMCLEERVLYRLLSGLHTSTTLSIAMKYYPPSKRKNRTDWEPNPDFFMEKFQHHPEHLRNLHFSYVVLLRALQKASSYLYDYEIRTGDIVDDETASVLLRRLLDSSILDSCSSVFSAFDESLMFQEEKDDPSKNKHVVSLQKNFKGVFHNVSSILDCVQCQQCKLHGKMAMLGYGTALKILFIDDAPLTPEVINRNEIVALINTIAKFSESLLQVRELTHLYWERQQEKVSSVTMGSSSSSFPEGGEQAPHDVVSVTESIDLVDKAVGVVAELGKQGRIAWNREAELVNLALARNPALLILVKHYGSNTAKFLELSKSIGDAAGTVALPDAIVVGSGLAGLAASLNILDRGGSVVIVEKEHLLGGNSMKASSGINACCPDTNSTDTQEVFMNDTIRSAGVSARPDLIQVLVSQSAEAVTWLKERAGVDLSLTAQLGGHSSKRTHRPSNGMAGAEIIYGMQKAVRAFEKSGRLKIILDTKVTKLITEADGTVVGVETTSSSGDGATKELRAPNVILATGGFASDRSSGSYLERYRPELLKSTYLSALL